MGDSCGTNLCGNGVVDSGEDCDLGDGSQVADIHLEWLVRNCDEGCLCPANCRFSDDGNSSSSSSEIILVLFSSASSASQASGSTGGDTGGTTGGDTGGNTGGNVGGTGGSNTSGGYTGSKGSNNSVSPYAHCGDGIIAYPEECDDDNRRDNDGCSIVCKSEIGVCGDGKIQSLLGEQCEQATHDASLSYRCERCRFVSDSCGDSVVDEGEECDRGAENANTPNATCRSDCSFPRCGDATTDDVFLETCDDGNRTNEDGCDRDCHTEDASEDGATHGAAIASSGCGDGVLAPPEQCDDGNDVMGDGCSTACVLHFGAQNAPLTAGETNVLSEVTGISVAQIEALQTAAGSPAALGPYIMSNPQLLGAFLASLPPEQAQEIARRLGIPYIPGIGFSQMYPLAQLQPLVQSRGPVGDTGPAAVAVVGAGAAAGIGWMRRRRR